MQRDVVSVAFCGAAVALMSWLTGCGEETVPVATAPPPREVEIIQPVAADLPVDFGFVGRTESSQRVEIRARVDGYLDEIAYAEGEFVQEGETLFRIDRSPFESRLRAAKSELAQHTARLENAESLLARIVPLAEANAVAQKELDDAQGGVREAAAAVEGAAARVFDAELNLGYTEITAPVRGLTGSSAEREGAYISGIGGPLTYVAKIDPMWVEFSVTETQLLRNDRAASDGRVVRPERGLMDVEIVLSDGRTHPHLGRISFSDASVSTQTGAVLVRAEIPNPEETLRPGQYVQVHVKGAYRPGAIMLPQRAIFEGPKGAYVWVVNRENAAEQRPVTLGPWQGDAWIIETGIGENDRVVVNGGMGLRPGTPLTIGRILLPGASGSGGAGSSGSNGTSRAPAQSTEGSTP